MDHVDSCVIGAGVVGLAIARALSSRGREVLVVDREDGIGEGISSRNSEVIHAGIYYPENSLKAITCVHGKEMLYRYCRVRNVAHRQCGKLIVATAAEEEETLDDIRNKARANGVEDLAFWTAAEVAQAEPAVKATLALFSPSTGIVSSHELMTAYLADLQAAGGEFVGRAGVTRVDIENTRFIVSCEIRGAAYRFSSRILINSGGLGAQAIARSIQGLDETSVPPLYLCKGSYFTLMGKSPFRRLIYPVPEKSGAGLGVHATLDLGGQVKFGPDVEYIAQEDYNVAAGKLAQYYSAVRRYYPGLKDGALSPGYSGIRPKLRPPGEPPADFVIQGPQEHGIGKLVQLFGIESPGLTSSLAIADHVIRLLNDAL